MVWSDIVESKQAIDLLSLWVAIDVEDGLELLSAEFTDPHVRYHSLPFSLTTLSSSFAVGQLKRAEDEELQLYLLQLVQAIKFEGLGNPVKDRNHDSSLVLFLIDRGVSNPILGNLLYWYLMVECEEKTFGKMYGRVVFDFLKILIQVGHVRIHLFPRLQRDWIVEII